MLNKSCDTFLQELSSAAAVPGGGGAAALGGAVGVALGSMVGNLTLGKKKYADVEEDIKLLLATLSESQERMKKLVQADADAFLPLSKAYGLPKETEEERTYKEEVMEKALRQACSVPLELLKESVFALKVMGEMEKRGTRIAVSDIAVGAVFLRAAAQGAAMNVYTNTRLMKDKAYSQECDRMTEQMVSDAVAMADQLYQKVEEELR